jgi:hypothetical protein
VVAAVAGDAVEVVGAEFRVSSQRRNPAAFE